jgi:hypothetical protein
MAMLAMHRHYRPVLIDRAGVARQTQTPANHRIDGAFSTDWVCKNKPITLTKGVEAQLC